MRTELFWIDGPWSGRLGIMPRPRGADWLEDEVNNWKRAGVNTVVSCLESSEATELELGSEADFCRTHGVEFVSLPISDRGVPTSMTSVAELARKLELQLSEGKSVAIHCRQGVGRSALVAASVLTLSGLDADTALGRVQTARKAPVPDTPEQRAWLTRFARDTLAKA